MSWKTLTKIIKKQIIVYTGTFKRSIKDIFRNTKTGMTKVIGLNQTFIFSIHGTTFTHEYGVDGDTVVGNSQLGLREPSLQSNYYYYYYLYKNGVRTPMKLPSTKGMIVVVKAADTSCTLTINEKRHYIPSYNLNRPTIIWFSDKLPVTIDVENSNGNVMLSYVGYYPIKYYATNNVLLVTTDIGGENEKNSI